MKKILIPIIIISVILISGCIGSQGTYKLDYHGVELLFNSNLDDAKNINITPSEDVLRETLFGYRVAQLQLVNYKNATEQPSYTRAIIPFASKYAKLSILKWSYDMAGKVSYAVLDDMSQMPNATIENPAVLLIGPGYTNETKIVVDGRIVKVYAKDLTLRKGMIVNQTQIYYTDFDLALDKIILVLAED